MDIGQITGCVGVTSDPCMIWGFNKDTFNYMHNSALPYDDKFPTGFGYNIHEV